MEKEFYRKYDTAFRIVNRLISPVVAGRADFAGEKLPDIEGPKFILCNHNTDFDFLLLLSVSREPLDFVATETMLRMSGISKFAANYFKPILHDKGSKGTGTIKQIVTRIKEGRNVVLFPEGNRSFDGRTGNVSDAIGKIAKMTAATLVVYRLTGGYLTTPRWGKGLRKGRMGGKVIKVISPDKLKEMSPEEIRKEIAEGLYTDAYKEQEERPIRFKCKAPAEYLETLLFICPSCKKIGTLSSKKNLLSCSCGYHLTMDEYGYLSEKDKEKLTITRAFDEQKKLLEERACVSKEELLWKDDVHLLKMSVSHNILEEKDISLLAYADKLQVGESSFPREDISSVDIVQRNRLMIHRKGESGHLELLGDETFNAVKYQLLF